MNEVADIAENKSRAFVCLPLLEKNKAKKSIITRLEEIQWYCDFK